MAKKKKTTTAKKKTKKKATKKKAKKKKKSQEPEPSQMWESLKEKVDTSKAVPYQMNGSYQSNQAIEHPKFGLGVVTNALNHKIEVVFEDGQKDLVHNRQG